MTTAKPAAPKLLRQRVMKALRQHLNKERPAHLQAIAPFTTIVIDRLYELSCLLRTLQEIKTAVGATSYDCRLAVAGPLRLRAAHGPIDPKFQHLDLTIGGGTKFTVWTNIEIQAVSALGTPALMGIRGRPNPHVHELDVVILRRLDPGRHHPLPADVAVGVEVKNRPYNKELLKQVLGVRREMGMLDHLRVKNPLGWPTAPSFCKQGSWMVAFACSNRILTYASPGAFFGITMLEHRL